MLETKIKNKFKEVNKVFFDKENNNTYLRVEVSLKNLEEITDLSRKISKFLDGETIEEENYFLDVYSSGTDKILDKEDLSEYVNTNVLITLKNSIKDKKSFEGKLIEQNPITIKWNAKGQFRNQEIEKENIKEIKLYAKAGK